MKTRKIGQITYSAGETGAKNTFWLTDYRGASKEKGAVQVVRTDSNLTYTSTISGILDPSESPTVWAELKSAQNNNYYHQDVPLVDYIRVDINVTSNEGDGGAIDIWVME